MTSIMKLAVLGLTLALAPTTYANPTLYVAHGGGNVGAPFGGEIGTIDLTTGSYSTLTTLGSLTSLVWNGTSLYTYETQTNEILEIDPNTGAVLSSVPLSGGPSALTDMAYDPTTGSYYGVGTDFNLYSLNIGTGVATFISATLPPFVGGFRQIAFAPDGTLYMHATNSPGEFWTINPSTGAIITTISGGVPGGALGLAVDPTTGLLIASECCGGGGGERGEKLFSVDPSDGSATLLYDYDDARRMQDFTFVELDSDGDGVKDDDDLCPDTAPGDPVDANGCSDAQVDDDADGVCDPGAVSNGPSMCVGEDACADTAIPEGVPTVRLGTNRWALVDDDFDFDTTPPKGKGSGRSYSTADTAGCSCEQIIEAQGLGNGHTKFGCSIGAMDNWVDLVSSP